LLTVHVIVIPESLTAPTTTISPPIPPLISLKQQSTSITTSTNTEATTSTTTVPDSETLSAIHLRVSNLEKEVKELKNVDHASALRATIKSKVPVVVKEYLRTSLDDALYKVLQKHNTDLSKEHSILADVMEKLKQQGKPLKSAEAIQKVKIEQAGKQLESQYTIKSFDKAALKEFDHKRVLFETMTASKHSTNILSTRLYIMLLWKKEADDADRDEYPPAGPDQGLKRKKTGKDTKQSKKDKSTPKAPPVVKAGDTQVPQDLGKDMGNTDEPPVVKAGPKDWFKKPKRPPTPDPEWNEGKTVDNKPTQEWLSDLAKAETSSKTFDDLISTPIDFSEFVMNCLQISDLTQDILKRVKDLQLGVESYQKKLNISKPRIREEDLSRRAPYTTLSDAQGVIYEEKLNRKRLMRYDELYKFSFNTL
ncbi:hypothetical protein Tco_0815115, partial [Tanacetum coccineum]